MSAKEFGGLGFAAGVVRGARSFKVDKLGRLTGIHYEQIWRPGENIAECRKEKAVFHVTFNWDGITSSGRLGYLQAFPNYPPPPPSSSRTVVSTPPSVHRKKKGKKVVADIISMPEPPKAAAIAATEKKPHTMADCACGFYGYYDGSEDYWKDGYVSAVIEGYGEALIGTRGFRVAKARIVALMIPAEQDRFANRIARNYPDVPLFRSFNEMVAAFPPDGGEEAVTPDVDDFWTRDA